MMVSRPGGVSVVTPTPVVDQSAAFSRRLVGALCAIARGRVRQRQRSTSRNRIGFALVSCWRPAQWSASRSIPGSASGQGHERPARPSPRARDRWSRRRRVLGHREK